MRTMQEIGILTNKFVIGYPYSPAIVMPNSPGKVRLKGFKYFEFHIKKTQHKILCELISRI